MSGTVHIDTSGECQTVSAGGYRFPRTAKLLKHASFDQVYRRGQRHFSGLMTVFFLHRESPAAELSSRETPKCARTSVVPGEGLAGPRVGLTVGRVLGPAVARNRIKRRMREAVRFNLHELKGPVDIVINPKKTVLTADFRAVAEEVRRAFIAVEKRQAHKSAISEHKERMQSTCTKGSEE